MSKSGSESFDPIQNPYIVGNPIKGRRMFFGREDDFAYIKTKCSSDKEGGLIVLCGARRSGKTSILFQIQDGRLGDDFHPVLIDMQSMAVQNDRDFLDKIVQIISNDGVTTGLESSADENPFLSFEKFIDRLKDQIGDKKLVLAFDEYELIETFLDSGTITSQILHTLANLIEHRQVFVVFTGSDHLEARSKKYWDMFLSKALHRRISFLSRKDTLRLIHDPLEGVIEYEDGVADEIADLTAGQPFYTQVLCQSLVDYLNDEHRYNVNSQDVARVLDEVIENPLPQMIFHWNALSEIEKLTLSILAEVTREDTQPVDAARITSFAQEESIGYRFDAVALNKTLEKLFHDDLIVKSADADTYMFKMGLWRDWAKRMHSVWKVIGEIERNGGPAANAGIKKAATGGGRKKAVWGAIAATAAVVVVGGYFLRDVLIPPPENPVNTAIVQPTAAAARADITVKSEPPGADVWLDGAFMGQAPVEQQVPAGDVAVMLRRSGYESVTDTVTLVEDESRSVSYALVEMTGQLRIESTPPGAAIRVDGAATGRMTPATIEGLSVNSAHQIVLQLTGYNSGRYSAVRVEANSTTPLKHTFSVQMSPLTVASQPVGAEIWIDGKQAGVTPQALQRVSHGQHDVMVRLDGYADWSRALEIPVPGDRLDVELVALAPGRILFSVQPWADVYVDGSRVAQNVSFYELSYSPGSYIIELRNPDYDAFSREYRIVSGETLRIDHTFND